MSSGMDSALRRRFLKSIDFDLAAAELKAEGVLPNIIINGPDYWPRERAWWLDADPTPVQFTASDGSARSGGWKTA